MTPTLVVPMFTAGAEMPWHRVNALRLLKAHLSGLGWETILGTGVSPAAGRNRGARRAAGDVVVFNDADTFVPLEQIRVAASLAADVPGLVFAFTSYTRLSEGGTACVETIKDVFTVDPAEVYEAPPSHGCVAVRADAFWEAGGYDERLEAFEDCALTQRCEERWPTRRVDGPAVHLWHPRHGDVGDAAWEERFAGSRETWEREYLGIVPSG